MKKLVLLLPLILLVGCTNNIEENKYAYLEYKHELEEQKEFSTREEIDFNAYFNIERENEEVVNYSIAIQEPNTDMHNVKALLIHDYVQEEAFPSIGILDEPVELQKDSEDRIVLEGKIQTIEDISDVKFKLYLEYIDSEGNENKIYYQVLRG